MLNSKITNWLKQEKKINKLNVKIIKLSNLDNWNFNNKEITHKSGKFFKIVGLKVYSNFFKKNWDQPIIIQKEVGILGIIKNNNKYLLQAKVEPGNKNKIQISPTVQATKSNYNKVHKGKKVPYLDYFLRANKKNIINQSEQGFRYLNKFNSNILINVSKKINHDENFYWFSKNEIKYLITTKKNIVNMDTISIFSSFIKRIKSNYTINTDLKIIEFIKRLDKKFFIKIKPVHLKKIVDWSVNKVKIVNKSKKFFSVIGVDVQANKREINNWSQPIIKGKRMAFAGFLKAKFNNTNHYLCRYVLKPGIRNSVIGCTVNTSDIDNYRKNLNQSEKHFIKNFFFLKKNKKNVVFDNILSDEGGRFYNCQIRYMVMLIDNPQSLNIPNNFLWISHNQIVKMINNKKLDIESRLLFACDNIDKIK